MNALFLLKIKIRINKILFFIKTRRMVRNHSLICKMDSIILYQPLLLHENGGIYRIGENVQFGYDIGGRFQYGFCELQARTTESSIEIGNHTAINNNFVAISSKKIVIGNHCRIGINCQIMDLDAHNIDPKRRSELGKVEEVIIDDNVWIGNNVIILSGVHIGCNTVVGAGAVVTKDIPSNVICGGVPAKIIKHIDAEMEESDK